MFVDFNSGKSPAKKLWNFLKMSVLHGLNKLLLLSHPLYVLALGLITGIRQVKETAEGYPTMAEKCSWPAAHHFLAHVPCVDWRQRS